MYYNRNCFFGQPKSSTTKVLLFWVTKSNTLGYIFDAAESNTLGLTVVFQEPAQVPIQVG